MITGNKFEVWHLITIDNKTLYETKDKKISDDSIIRIAEKEYDCRLTKKDIEQMRKNFEHLLRKYRMLL
ncbi:hypothetical protein ES705_43654 [subsurface metagenome]|jgi:hypothetical protein